MTRAPEDTTYRRGRAGTPHAFELLWDEAVEVRLEWRQDATSRADLGWWYERIGRARAPRRLNVEPAILDLAADQQRSATEWCDDADSLAMLTTDAALRHAERLLHGRVGPLAAKDPGVVPRTYEVLVTGADAVTVALAFPDGAIREWRGMVVLSDDFEDASLRAAFDRLAQLGARIAGVLPADDC